MLVAVAAEWRLAPCGWETDPYFLHRGADGCAGGRNAVLLDVHVGSDQSGGRDRRRRAEHVPARATRDRSPRFGWRGRRPGGRRRPLGRDLQQESVCGARGGQRSSAEVHHAAEQAGNVHRATPVGADPVGAVDARAAETS